MKLRVWAKSCSFHRTLAIIKIWVSSGHKGPLLPGFSTNGKTTVALIFSVISSLQRLTGCFWGPLDVLTRGWVCCCLRELVSVTKALTGVVGLRSWGSAPAFPTAYTTKARSLRRKTNDSSVQPWVELGTEYVSPKYIPKKSLLIKARGIQCLFIAVSRNILPQILQRLIFLS